MATLTHRLSHRFARMPLRWRFAPARGFERVLSFLDLIMDVSAETRELARTAHKRFPYFAEW